MAASATNFDTEAALGELVQRFPGRGPQARQLLRYLGKPADPSPPFLFVYGHQATGKTSVLKQLLKPPPEFSPRHQYPSYLTAYVNCTECFTPRLVFETILGQFWAVQPSFATGGLGPIKCEDMYDFSVQLAGQLRRDATRHTRYIVFDHAERLRGMGATFLPAILKLPELCQYPISIIMVSCVIWDRFRPRNGVLEPILLQFPIYAKDDMLQILCRDCPTDETVDFFGSFASVVYDVFHRNCRDVNELRHLVALLFPKFREPVVTGRAKRSETAKLFRLCQTYFAAAADKLYLREISSAQWLQSVEQTQPGSDSDSDSPAPPLATPTDLSLAPTVDFELPYYTKFLLIASFLASYNPARLDVRYFAKGKESNVHSKRSKSAIQKQMMTNTGGRLRQQLTGPKAFPLERMLAIFYSIIDDPIENTIEVQSQIATLITLRMLARSSPAHQLDGVKCKCNVSYDLIRRISRSVHFEIDRYLYDFA